MTFEEEFSHTTRQVLGSSLIAAGALLKDIQLRHVADEYEGWARLSAILRHAANISDFLKDHAE